MKNKNLLIVIIAILLLGGGALFLFKNQNKTGDDAITSIKDIMMKSASMECNYTDEEGRKSKAYIKNGAVRSDYTGASEDQSGSVIVTNKKMYMWNGKKGFMIDIPEVTPGQEEVKESKTEQKEKLIADLEKYKQYCKSSVVSDSLFTPPSDVDFQDYSQMMKDILPTGGAGMNEEQVKQYMQQYGNPQQ